MARRITMQRVASCGVAFFYCLWSAISVHGYAFNQVVPDLRQPANSTGGSACPIPSHQLHGVGAISVRWSTALNANPQTILTMDQTVNGKVNEIEQVVRQSLGVWMHVSGTALASGSLGSLTRTATAIACGSDGVNSICFDQPDAAFTPGVLAFTRVITADAIGIQIGDSPVSTEAGQILDADIYFNPSNSSISFSTPSALGSTPKSYDLESILTHELGHFFGFSHSAVWGAIMFPFAPSPGTFAGTRPTSQQPDAPLSDDDRSGLRTLYSDPLDTNYVGAIQGRVLPANPLSLPAAAPWVTGIFAAHVVAVDVATGSVVAGALGGWSCAAQGPVQFDGSYLIEHLPVGRSYAVYAEPLDGAVTPAEVSNAIVTLCRNNTTDPGWPPQDACVVPPVNTQFTTRMRPAP